MPSMFGSSHPLTRPTWLLKETQSFPAIHSNRFFLWCVQLTRPVKPLCSNRLAAQSLSHFSSQGPLLLKVALGQQWAPNTSYCLSSALVASCLLDAMEHWNMDSVAWVFKSDSTDKEIAAMVTWRNEAAMKSADILKTILGLKTKESSTNPVMARCGPLRKDIEDHVEGFKTPNCLGFFMISDQQSVFPFVIFLIPRTCAKKQQWSLRAAWLLTAL